MESQTVSIPSKWKSYPRALGSLASSVRTVTGRQTSKSQYESIKSYSYKGKRRSHPPSLPNDKSMNVVEKVEKVEAVNSCKARDGQACCQVIAKPTFSLGF